MMGAFPCKDGRRLPTNFPRAKIFNTHAGIIILMQASSLAFVMRIVRCYHIPAKGNIIYYTRCI